MSHEMILTDTKDRVGIITFNRPEKLNALHPTMSAEMQKQIAVWNKDPGIGAIVLTGAGRSFCSGADIGSWHREIGQGEEGKVAQQQGGDSWVTFAMESKPIVCAINGAAIGAGLTIALPCDIRIASDQASLSMRFIRIGILPISASTHLLSRVVGIGHAMELMLSGKIIDAEEAGRIGLVNRVVPHEKLLEEAVDTAAQIAFNPSEHLMVTKQMAWQNLDEGDLSIVQERETAASAAAFASPEFKEAIQAFLEKRAPDFHGK